MKVLVLYYSMFGHVHQLATAVYEGVLTVSGVEGVIRKVDEFPEVCEKYKNDEFYARARERQHSIPVCTLEDFEQADGVVLGSPTRYGNVVAQVAKFLGTTAGLWQRGAMEGKPAGLFTSTATTHGGQESTLLSMTIPLLHMGMLIVGVPYSTPGMLHTEGRGGTPYGASTVAGPRNDRQPTKEDLDIARALGARVAGITRKVRG